MNKKAVSVCALAIALGILGCSNTSEFIVSPISPSVTSPIGSDSSRLHDARVTFVSASFSGELEALPTCNIEIQNGGDAPFAFSNDIVAVYSGKNTVRLYEAMELAEKIAEVEKEKTNEYNAHQNEVFLGTQSTSSDPSATIARMRAADRTNQFAGKKKTYDAQKKAISMMIMPSFVAPGDSASGYIVLHTEDLVAGEPLRVVLTLGDEDQEFLFSLSK